MSAKPQSSLRWRHFVPLALGLVLIVWMAVVQGRLSDRWDDSQADALQLAARLPNVPERVGDWSGKPQEQSQAQLEASGAVGHIARAYVNTRDGRQVSMFLVSGHNRDVSQHTPDRCYPAAGFSQIGAQTTHQIEVDGETAVFHSAVFRKETPEGVQNVRIFWTWGHDDRWLAPDSPRNAFAGVRGLYKLYLVEQLGELAPAPEESPCLAFAGELISVASKVLFVVEQAEAESTEQ
jgi:hypothetical protein